MTKKPTIGQNKSVFDMFYELNYMHA